MDAAKLTLITAGLGISIACLLGWYTALILSGRISREEEQQERETPPTPINEETAEALHDDGKRYSGLLEDDVYD